MLTVFVIAHVLAAPARRLALAGAALALLASVEAVPQPVAGAPQPPHTLAETGLYADAATRAVDPRHLAFSPQYPLWTDGAAKSRWISLPAGTAIDASDPDAWVFPVGTRLWKEFSFDGRPVETRYLERTAEGWLYAAYAWDADGRAAVLVSARGRRNAYPLGNGRAHAIPGVDDCKACHQGGRSEVLGFSALQLSPDRDPNALHAEAASALDLAVLVEKGLLVGLPRSFLDAPPRIAATAIGRAALGYLHGNCGHCHNPQGPLRNLGLYLRHAAGAPVPPAVATTVGAPVRKPAPGLSPEAVQRVAPHAPDRSALMQRLASRYAPLQMPPLGTELVDSQAVALIRRWIAETDHFTTAADPQEK
ncbi:MAG: hypothetical protein M5U07_08250 [Xanthobacteraceae bacterium]|nr:hypothetical protein [Xanthobacteraceae bacterium]